MAIRKVWVQGSNIANHQCRLYLTYKDKTCNSCVSRHKCTIDCCARCSSHARSWPLIVKNLWSSRNRSALQVDQHKRRIMFKESVVGRSDKLNWLAPNLAPKPSGVVRNDKPLSGSMQGKRCGALGRSRTDNLLIRSQMLYPLSYECNA